MFKWRATLNVRYYYVFEYIYYWHHAGTLKIYRSQYNVSMTMNVSEITFNTHKENIFIWINTSGSYIHLMSILFFFVFLQDYFTTKYFVLLMLMCFYSRYAQKDSNANHKKNQHNTLIAYRRIHAQNIYLDNMTINQNKKIKNICTISSKSVMIHYEKNW